MLEETLLYRGSAGERSSVDENDHLPEAVAAVHPISASVYIFGRRIASQSRWNLTFLGVLHPTL